MIAPTIDASPGDTARLPGVVPDWGEGPSHIELRPFHLEKLHGLYAPAKKPKLPTDKQNARSKEQRTRGPLDISLVGDPIQGWHLIILKHGLGLRKPPQVTPECDWWKRPEATFSGETIKFPWYAPTKSKCSPSIKLFTGMRQIVMKYSPFANDYSGAFRFQQYQFAHLTGEFQGGKRTATIEVQDLAEHEESQANPSENPKERRQELRRVFSIIDDRRLSWFEFDVPEGMFNTFSAADTRPWRWPEFIPPTWTRTDRGFYWRGGGYQGELRYKYVDPIFTDEDRWLLYHTGRLETWLPFRYNTRQAFESAWSKRDRERVPLIKVPWPKDLIPPPRWTRGFIPKDIENKKFEGVRGDEYGAHVSFYALDGLMPEAYEQRKELHLYASKVLQGLTPSSNSVYLGELDPLARCPTCGNTFFTRKSGLLFCRDCGWFFKYEYDPEALLEDEDGTPLFDSAAGDRVVERDPDTGMIYDPNGGVWRRWLSPHEFMEALVVSGQMAKIHLGLNLRKNAYTRAILVEGWLPEDVSLITGELESTIKSRADALYDECWAHKVSNEPITVTAQDILAWKLILEKYRK